MSYIKVEEILPIEIIEMIQQYVDGANIYIPRKKDNRAGCAQMRKEYCCKKTCNTHLARKVCNPLMNEGLGELMWACPLFKKKKMRLRFEAEHI